MVTQNAGVSTNAGSCLVACSWAAVPTAIRSRLIRLAVPFDPVTVSETVYRPGFG